MPPTNHALLGASSAARWIACPPSARLVESLPEDTSKYAEEGTRAHELCEQHLRMASMQWDLGENPKIKTAPDAPDDVKEMARAAETYVDFIYDTWVAFPCEPSVFIEQKVWYNRWVPEGFGTCDCLLIGDGILHIVDFKYGKGVPVSPEKNPQMMCYALGAYDMFKATDTIKTVRMSIVQPRVQTEPETWELSAKELLEWARDVLAPAAKLAWAGKGERQTGEHCRFCKAYPACGAWQDKYGALADFEQLPEPDLLLDTDALGEWLEKVRGLAQYAKDLEEYALAAILAGNSVTGWKVVEGQSKRRWSNQEAAFKAMTQAGADPEKLYKPRELITLTDAEKLLGKKKFKEACGDFIIKPAGPPKLVPESDTRPAFNPVEGFKEEAEA